MKNLILLLLFVLGSCGRPLAWPDLPTPAHPWSPGAAPSGAHQIWPDDGPGPRPPGPSTSPESEDYPTDPNLMLSVIAAMVGITGMVVVGAAGSVVVVEVQAGTTAEAALLTAFAQSHTEILTVSDMVQIAEIGEMIETIPVQPAYGWLVNVDKGKYIASMLVLEFDRGNLPLWVTNRVVALADRRNYGLVTLKPYLDQHYMVNAVKMHAELKRLQSSAVFDLWINDVGMWTMVEPDEMIVPSRRTPTWPSWMRDRRIHGSLLEIRDLLRVRHVVDPTFSYDQLNGVVKIGLPTSVSSEVGDARDNASLIFVLRWLNVLGVKGA